jgi:predicted alpha-1,2-mannosidase
MRDRSRRLARRLLLTGALTGLIALAVMTSAGAAVATRSLSSVTGSTASLGSPPVCSTTASGHLTDCPPPLPKAELPPGARRSALLRRPVTALAQLVDTRTWTSGGGNTFPGADVPFGMVQWSPDTAPHRSDGGGYTYGDRQLSGYSLTHVSGPGCRAAGDVGILPMTGRLPDGNPTYVTTAFTNAGEQAQAGYYSARSNSPGTITSQFTATAHTAMGAFTFPSGSRADFLVKLMDSQKGNAGSSAAIVSNHEIVGSDTSGDFCGETGAFGRQLYTVYFDIYFDRPFIEHRVIFRDGRKVPNSVFVVFSTAASRQVQAHVSISYVSVADAQLNRERETPGWDFAHVRTQAQDAWNSLLGEIAVSGGSEARTQEFYSLLYKAFLQPNIISDVNGDYRGSDGNVHQLPAGQHNEYGMFSGWDTYHSLAQLQAMLDPPAASDMAQSLVNEAAQNGILPQWGYLSLDNYEMTGDPADALIADYFAFGATGFDTTTALSEMLRQATTVNRVRPGEALEAQYGYLPENAQYGCCGARNPTSSLLEYDTADFALSRFAAALSDTADATTLQARADNWVNLLDPKNKLFVPRMTNGSFLAGVNALTSHWYTEGNAGQYVWDVPNDYAGLFAKLGGAAKVRPALVAYLSEPNGGGRHALISNEFDDGEQFALDYAGDPAGTQRAVATIRDQVYLPGPSGLNNNDDLGSESSQFIWDMLGFYPENPGSDALVFASPGFSHIVIALSGGHDITISAPGASASRFYVSSLTINGTADTALYVPFSSLSTGATLDWTLSDSPTSWGSAPTEAPPSYPPAG